MRYRVPLFALAPALLAPAACSVSAPGSAFSAGPAMTAVGNPAADAGAGESAPAAEDDAGSGVDAMLAQTQQNNVLCLVTTSGCDPDAPDTASNCHESPDGGSYDPSAGYGAAVLACRVEPSAVATNDSLGMATWCSVAGAGMTGNTCSTSTDCGAGFDCVGATSPTCRHYCCAGNSQCASSDFCDIQPLAAASTTKVPVCMPIEHDGCSLLTSLPNAASPSMCGPDQTCAIVREDGTTGCVEVGGKTADQSCDTDHCAAGYVCLGALNERLCYALCDTTKSECSAPQTCQGGLPLFQDPTVGVCR
jgi:hypothetical protein